MIYNSERQQIPTIDEIKSENVNWNLSILFYVTIKYVCEGLLNLSKSIINFDGHLWFFLCHVAYQQILYTLMDIGYLNFFWTCSSVMCSMFPYCFFAKTGHQYNWSADILGWVFTYMVVFGLATVLKYNRNWQKSQIIVRSESNHTRVPGPEYTCCCCCCHLSDDCGVTSISLVLPVLSKMMDGMKNKSDSQLLPCLGLEKEVAGALLLARREEVVEHILHLHRNNQVQRKYWYVTVWTD